MDEEGYYFIDDRLKRMIDASGFRIWPAEVVGLLHGHPSIQEVCIIAAKDPYCGETTKALIVLRDEIKMTRYQKISFFGRRKICQLIRSLNK